MTIPRNVDSYSAEERGEGRGRGREAVQTRGVIVITTVRVPSPSNVGGDENSRLEEKNKSEGSERASEGALHAAATVAGASETERRDADADARATREDG